MQFYWIFHVTINQEKPSGLGLCVLDVYVCARVCWNSCYIATNKSGTSPRQWQLDRRKEPKQIHNQSNKKKSRYQIFVDFRWTELYVWNPVPDFGLTGTIDGSATNTVNFRFFLHRSLFFQPIGLHKISFVFFSTKIESADDFLFQCLPDWSTKTSKHQHTFFHSTAAPTKFRFYSISMERRKKASGRLAKTQA